MIYRVDTWNRNRTAERRMKEQNTVVIKVWLRVAHGRYLSVETLPERSPSAKLIVFRLTSVECLLIYFDCVQRLLCSFNILFVST